jgi:hypothetical protein
MIDDARLKKWLAAQAAEAIEKRLRAAFNPWTDAFTRDGLWATVKGEEAWLLDAFGEPYAAYLARTPRFWPDFSKWRDADTLEVRPRFFLTTVKDGLVFLLALPIFELLEHAQEMGWIHTWLTLP